MLCGLHYMLTHVIYVVLILLRLTKALVKRGHNVYKQSALVQLADIIGIVRKQDFVYFLAYTLRAHFFYEQRAFFYRAPGFVLNLK